MKRILKNIIEIVVIVILIGAIIFTLSCAKSDSKNSMSSMQGNQMGTPPEKPNGNNGDEMGTPPEKPNGNNGDEMGNPPEKPDGDNGGEMQSPPEKPDDSENGKQSQNDNTQKPPDMPNGSDQEKQGTPPNGKNDMDGKNGNNDLSMLYIILIIVESLVFSLIIIHLIISKFNKKKFKETFNKKSSILIYIASVIIVSSLLAFGLIYIGNNVLTNSNSKEMKMDPSSGNEKSVDYSASNEIKETSTLNGEEYNSEKSDENALLVNGEIEVSADDITVTKTGDSDGGDNTSFYGTNSAVIAKDKAKLTLKNINVETNATGANGVFSYGGVASTKSALGDGTTINISDSKIVTKKDNSGGIMTTGGGVTNATNLTIETSGISSAAIRSDRGGGKVKVNKGTYKTSGQGSPAIYSTADITVKNANLIATASEGIVIEGKNKVTIENTKVEDTNNKLNGQSTTYKNIFLYQSMSGDADDGISQFASKDSEIITNKGDTFYVTNTKSKITLENNTITNNDKAGNFLRVQKDSWGNNGSNGGEVNLNATNQKMYGNIVIDSLSKLKMNMIDSSYFEGAINNENSAKLIKLKISKNSKIKLTNDTYVSSLEDEDETYSNIDFNGFKLYVNGKSINNK